MSVTLRQPLTLAECMTIREWRNDPAVAPMLRTGTKTEAEQYQFYVDHIYWPWWARFIWWLAGRQREHEYYAIEYYGAFVGMGGLTYLNRTPGEAEISLIIGPMYRGAGIGSWAVDALLEEASRLGLERVIGECYATGHRFFWLSQIKRFRRGWGIPRPINGIDGSLHWHWERT